MTESEANDIVDLWLDLLDIKNDTMSIDLPKKEIEDDLQNTIDNHANKIYNQAIEDAIDIVDEEVNVSEYFMPYKIKLINKIKALKK